MKKNYKCKQNTSSAKEPIGVRSRENKSLQDIYKAEGSLTEQNLGQRKKMLLNS